MNDSVKNKDLFYLVHPDRLGSYTHITNANKQVIRNLHFDPWGNVKSDTNWLTFDSTTLSGNLAGTFRFSRGFTGHEHYADLKIINMKAPSKREQKQACLIFVEREVLRDEVSTYGRLYDPVIARFFSPDNFVQAPEFTQSYNRYSYCLNNPLQWVDPSGEEMFTPETLYGNHSSLPRNKNIANAFFKAGFIDAWGRGYKKIREGFEGAGLPMPMVENFCGGVRVTLQRKNVLESALKTSQKTSQKIIELIRNNAEITTQEMAEAIGIDRRNITRNLKKLRDQKIIIRVGGDKGGHWEVVSTQ